MSDYFDHLCMVCFQAAQEHAGYGPEHENYPGLPLCCAGCGCGCGSEVVGVGSPSGETQ